ncbi:MAG: hypothetical protein ACM3JQ_00690 [Candidatus Eiseniibacteriota bacterium]
MTKMYVKDSNGKYRLVDRDQQEIGKPLENFSEGKVIQEILARVKRLESIVIDPRR